MQTVEQTIRETFSRWTSAWNAGDIEGYLVCYAAGDSTRYIGSKGVITGADAIADSFRKRFPSADKMGQLVLESLEVTVLSDNYAQLIGVFQHTYDGQVSGGVFTLLLQKSDDGWFIITDHSSALN